jgi:hypothetical protein
MPFTHDPALYLSIPTRTTGATMSLARALLGAAPAKPDPSVAKRLQQIHAKASALQTVWIAANRPNAGEGNRRASDLALDRSWGAVQSRLLDWIDIGKRNPDDDEAERAAALIALLLPTGLDFLKLPYDEQWPESERRIVLIDTDKLGSELDDLVDARIIKGLRSAHDDYGRVLGITQAKPDTDAGRVVDAIRELRTEMVGLARLVLGLADESDPAAVAAAETQLGPILRYRKVRAPGEADTSGGTLGNESGVANEPIDAPLPNPPVVAG